VGGRQLVVVSYVCFVLLRKGGGGYIGVDGYCIVLVMYSTVSWMLMLKKEREKVQDFSMEGEKEKKKKEKSPEHAPPPKVKNRKGLRAYQLSPARSYPIPPPPPICFFFFFWSLPFPPHQERFFIPSVLLRSPDREIWSYWRSRGNKNGGFLYGFDALLRYIIVWALVGRHVTLFVTFVSGPW